MIKQIKAFVLWNKDHLGNDQFRLSFCEMASCGYVTVDEQEFDVVIPDDFDPREKQVELLRKERERIGALSASGLSYAFVRMDRQSAPTG